MPEFHVKKQTSWLQFNIRDVLIAMALLAIGLAWPILFCVIVPIIVAGIIARMRYRKPVARALYIVAAIYPCASLLLIYLTWANAWLRSGARPIPYETEFRLDPPFDSLIFRAFRILDAGVPIAFLLGLASVMLIVEPRSPSFKTTIIARGTIFTARGSDVFCGR